MTASETIHAYYHAFNQQRPVAMLDLLTNDVVHDANEGDSEIGKGAFASFLGRMAVHYKETVEAAARTRVHFDDDDIGRGRDGRLERLRERCAGDVAPEVALQREVVHARRALADLRLGVGRFRVARRGSKGEQRPLRVLTFRRPDTKLILKRKKLAGPAIDILKKPGTAGPF